uniref:Uncharacterized protein n=1 Tax=Tanacetum cinerariifolium TaxID=118510 RepID=A0A699JR88_TANCI|nr:hypothetical protein [Tanacetum cinerariifolium]
MITDFGVGPSNGVNKNKADISKRVLVKRRRTSEKDNVKSLVLETRSSQRTFYNSISTLKPNQKACSEQIGFGNFVEFKVDGIPSKLGLYVVDKFDAKKMEIKLAEGALKITKNLISEMMGIRNEGVDIMAEEGNRNEEMVSSWMMQYGNKKDITPGDIKLRIRKSNSADMNFKLNFIVLFTSVMGKIKTKGFCDLKILDYIRLDTDMANINWCEYVLRCLQSCKEEWTKGKKNCFFGGPLTFLTMAYVDGSKCSSFNVIRKRPPTLIWTSELLRERDDEELNSGGFGFGEIKGPFVEQKDPMPDNIETLDAAEYMFPGKLEGFFERYVDALKYQGCRKEGSGNANISDANRAADAQADGQNNEGASFVSIQAMIGERVISLRDEHADIGMDQEGTADDNILGSPTLYNMGPETQSLANELVEKLLNENRFGSPSLYNMGPETQEEVLRSVDDVDATIERRKWFGMYDIPSFSLGVTQDFAHLDVKCTAVGCLRRDKDKRPVTISEVRKSPFIGRMMDADGSLNATEKRVTKYLFEVLEDHSVTLFETISGQQSTRIQMQTLAQREYVDNNILDTWGSVLNHMEVYRSK